MSDYRLGFTTQKREIQIDQLTVEGNIPGWLHGTLVRNGPGQFEVADTSYRHWFDGLSQLHSFHISQRNVSYANRFIRSASYTDDNATGKINYAGFAVDPCRSLFKRFFSVFMPEDNPRPNTNVNITQIADKYIAMTEIPMAVQFDPQTLETVGVVDYDDDINGQVTTAHPHYDHKRKMAINYVLNFGPISTYNFYGTKGSSRQLIASIQTRRPAYMHSFGITEDYIILSEFSFRLPNVLKLAFRSKPFIENYEWMERDASCFTVIEIDTGRVVAQAQADSFFAFHHINAYQEGDNIICDISAYPDAQLINQLYLKQLHEGKSPSIGEFRRYTIPLEGGRASYDVMSSESIELPRINYSRHNGRDYRYAYGASGRKDKQDFINQIVKVDVTSGMTMLWHEDNCYPGEPVFIQRPAPQGEDDGVVLTVVLDTEKDTSFLLIQDAHSFQEIARAYVPQHIPFGFHGQFFTT